MDDSIGDRLRRAAELRQMAERAYRLANGINPDVAERLRRRARELEQEAEVLERDTRSVMPKT
jgi:hypothetical protein